MRLDRPALGRLGFEGRGELCVVESDLLRGNPLGDPHQRELAVYLPPGHQRSNPLPVIYLLAGFTGRGQRYLEPHPWHRSLTQRFEAAVLAGESPPAILVMPDCFTRLGGSQYVDSSATGPYASHLLDELVPLVDAEFGARADRRAVVGKSSGGFGALHLCLERPGAFAAAASISGDVDFELCFGPELLACLRGLVPHQMDPGRFLEAFAREPDLGGDGHAVINVLAMAACYSPAPGTPLGFELPMDLERGERLSEVWDRWLQFDPLQASDQRLAALDRLDYLHLECGLADEYNLQWGLRRFVARLRRLEIAHVHEEHPGGHRGTDARFVRALTRIATVLSD